MLAFDNFGICQKYFDSVHMTIIDKKSMIFVTTNKMGRQFVSEIHPNDQIKAVYIFLCLDPTNHLKTKSITKYNKVRSYEISNLAILT